MRRPFVAGLLLALCAMAVPAFAGNVYIPIVGAVIDRISETARNGTSYGAPCRPEIELAERIAGIAPDVVGAQHAWWFPEKNEPGHGWEESNINILTDNSYESCDPAMGATSVRTLLCRISAEP